MKHFTGFLIALGLAIGGFFPGYFYYLTKMENRTVSVKGLSERAVVADLAVWNIEFNVTNTDVTEAQKTLSTHLNLIMDFLHQSGFTDDEISAGRINTNDLSANPYREAKDSRYILTQKVTVQSKNVYQVEKTLNKIGQLVEKGVVFANQEYMSPVAYLFTKLNDIKPEMLNEATQNAYKAAEEFAKNSGDKVGKIKTAQQGVFSILPREQLPNVYESAVIEKTVRVVSTIVYFLD